MKECERVGSRCQRDAVDPKLICLEEIHLRLRRRIRWLHSHVLLEESGEGPKRQGTFILVLEVLSTAGVRSLEKPDGRLPSGTPRRSLPSNWMTQNQSGSQLALG